MSWSPEQAFETGATFYGGYEKYRERASHREIQVFVLSLAGEDND